MKTKLIILILIHIHTILNGQKFTAVYPVSESPNIQLMSKMNEDEPILFEALPTVRFNLYNDFQKSFLKNNPFGKAFYISFRPHLRMYNEISKPVKTPSYRIYLASQWIWNIPSTSLTKQHYIGFMMESGHYSNGQARCAFSNEFEDEESSCKTIYENITEQTAAPRPI